MARTAEQMAEMARLGAAARLQSSKLTLEELVEKATKSLPGAHAGLVGERAAQMPFRLVRTYLRAMRGRSMAAGIKANCQHCMGWEDLRAGIRHCTDPACPLYPYRPYR